MSKNSNKRKKKKFYEKPDCSNCERRFSAKCYKHEDRVWKCPKRYKGIKVISSILAIPLIYIVFYKTLYMTGKTMFSIWLMVATMALIDVLFVGTGKFLTKFFGFLEQRKIDKQEEIEEQEKARKEEAKQKRKEAQADNIEKAKKLLEAFTKMSQTDDEEKILSSKFTSEEYKTFLEALSEICELLESEHFKELSIKNLFEILLPEFLSICKNFEMRYEGDFLEYAEREKFSELIKCFSEKMIEVKDNLKAGENVSLKPRIEILYSLIKSERGEQQDV